MNRMNQIHRGGTCVTVIQMYVWPYQLVTHGIWVTSFPDRLELNTHFRNLLRIYSSEADWSEA